MTSVTMKPENNAPQPTEKSSNKKFWIMLVLFSLPYLGAFVYFFFLDDLPKPPTTNHGDLISPVRQVLDVPLQNSDGQVVNQQLLGKWLLLTVGGSTCNDACEKRLVLMRQIHRATHDDSNRIERVYVMTETEHLKAFDAKYKRNKGMHIISAPATSIQALSNKLKNPNPVAEGGVYLIDPVGNYMMSYPADFTEKFILKDIERLLKVSQLG